MHAVELTKNTVMAKGPVISTQMLYVHIPG